MIKNTVNGDESADSWEKIYQDGEARWDIGMPTPPFSALMKSPPEWLTQGKIINFGAGPGHDAALFAKHGFAVTAIDFAPSAKELMQTNYSQIKNLTILQEDIFQLKRLTENFDYVLEHTCYCAIPVNSRKKYAQAAANVLKPHGILFGLFYRFDTPLDKEGPPFCMNKDDIYKNFEEFFDLFLWETPKKSHEKRQGRERLFAMRKKS